MGIKTTIRRLVGLPDPHTEDFDPTNTRTFSYRWYDDTPVSSAVQYWDSREDGWIHLHKDGEITVYDDENVHDRAKKKLKKMTGAWSVTLTTDIR
jgi:hypothetical protein